MRREETGTTTTGSLPLGVALRGLSASSAGAAGTHLVEAGEDWTAHRLFAGLTWSF